MKLCLNKHYYVKFKLKIPSRPIMYSSLKSVRTIIMSKLPKIDFCFVLFLIDQWTKLVIEQIFRSLKIEREKKKERDRL